MAWNDDEKTVFPTRFGGSIGTGGENRMINKVGGPDTIRTEIRKDPDGTVTMLRTHGGMPRFTTEKATVDTTFTYMTSGAYDLGTYSLAHPEQTTSVITEKSEALTAIETVHLSPLFKPKPPLDGQNSKIYNTSVLGPSSLTSAKLAMYTTPPSEFSGLMRRMVQGRYGVGNNSLKVGVVTTSGDNRVNLGSAYPYTSGVLRFGNAYFLATLTTEGNTLTVKGYPLTIPKKFRDILAAAVDEGVSAREALALAHATASLLEEIPLGTFSVPSGEPLAYGWNFSETTNVADVVVRYNPGYLYDRNIWSHLRVTFSYGATLSCSYSLVEQVDGWMLAANSPLWVPAGSATGWDNAYLNSPLPTSAQDIPIYAYYVGDSLKLVRWSFSSDTVAYDDAEWQEMVTAASWSSSFYGQGSCGYSVDMHYGTVMTHGFSISEGATAVLTSSSQHKERTGQMSMVYAEPQFSGLGFDNKCYFAFYFGSYNYTSYNSFSYPDTFAIGDSPPDPKPGNHFYKVETRGSSGSRQETEKTSVEGHTSCLVVPSGDCCAAYVGSRKMQSASQLDYTTDIGGAGFCHETKWGYIEGEIVELGEWYPPVKRQFSCGTSYPHVVSTNAESSSSAYTDYQQSIIYCGVISAEVGTSDSEVFHPGAYSMVLSSQVQAISSSILSDARYHVGTLTGGEQSVTSGYPTTIDLFIGAA